MSQRYMVKGLSHEWEPSGDMPSFFARIDAHGGWPVGYAFVGFEHTDECAAGFTNSPANNGWWTVVANADDYYLWKLSPAALQRVAEAVIGALQIPTPNAQSLWIKNSHGYRAVVASSKEQKA